MEILHDGNLNINHVAQGILVAWPQVLPVICAMK